MVYQILVGTYTNAVVTLEFDPSSNPPKLGVTSSLTVGHHPSWITRHPSNSSIIFTALEQPDGQLLALDYDLETGKGKVVAQVETGGHSPCTILATENQVFAGNYMGGSVAIFNFQDPSSTASEQLLNAAQPAINFSGTGPDPTRQEKSHPHQVYRYHLSSAPDSGTYEEVLVPDLGADKVWRLSRDSEGVWKAAGEVSFEGDLRGGGPRHIGIYDGVMYTLLELSNKLVAHSLPPLSFSNSSATSPVTVLAISPNRFPAPPEPTPLPMLSAEILIAAPNDSYPEPLIYTSNRNDPREGGDTIEVFSVLPAAYSLSSPASPTQLEHLATNSTSLNHLRSMVLFGPDSRYIVAGGANGGGIKVFERLPGGTMLKEIAWLKPAGDGSDINPTAFLVL